MLDGRVKTLHPKVHSGILYDRSSKKHSKQMTSFGLRPLTRDGAVYLVHAHHLYGVTDQGVLSHSTRDWDDIYD